MDNGFIIEKRLKKFRDLLDNIEIDGMMITKKENYQYLSCFTGTSAVLLITKQHAVIVTDFRYEEQASAQCVGYKVAKYEGKIENELKKQCEILGIKNLGFEASDVSYEDYLKYTGIFTNIMLVPQMGLVEKLRIIKDEDEIENIEYAVKIADKAFEEIIKVIKPGIKESDIAAELEYIMKKSGASGASFEIIVASGLRSSMPHGVASEKKIESGDCVTLDYGALYKGYCSDITRTVFVGQPKKELLKIYNIVLDAQKAGIEAAVEGKTGKEADDAARKMIYSAGYEGRFGHGLGHGLGLEIHESPRLSPVGEQKLENGMVVTVEPGIYIPGLGGVRIEDVVVINGANPRILTQAKKEVIIL